MVFHDEQTEFHAASIVSPTAPSTLSLGYPLHVGVEWTDTAGGGQVQKLCVAVDDGGNGTWQTIGLGIARVALGTGLAPGGIVAWPNPEASAILVATAYVLVTGAAPTGSRMALGGAPDAATVAYSFKGDVGLDYAGAAGATNSSDPVLLQPGEYVTGSATDTTPDLTGLAGYVYLHYHRA